LDWRVTLFAALLTFAVAFVCAFAPSLRVSEIEPAQALKGEERQSRRRLMLTLVATQVAFCFVIYFAAGLFVKTFERLAHQPNRIFLRESRDSDGFRARAPAATGMG
jgi:hypothetical protein